MVTGMKNIVIFVRELERAKVFYKDLLKLPLSGESIAMMEFFPGGGTTLGVALAMSDEAEKLAGRHTGITLTVNNLKSLCDGLSDAGVRFAEPFTVSPWGKMAVIIDPDDNQIALVEM